MKKSKRKIISILVITLTTIFMTFNVTAHSGRTDANGGHKDNKNKSGFGSYHYHCGGNPAHLHTNGVCPYSSGSSSSKSSTSSSSSSSAKTTSTIPTTVYATGIEINENIESIEVGESKIITATITPSNVTDKNIIWKSSDESIATISSTGEIVAKKSGTVNITATTTNGKTSIIKINIKEEPKTENTTIIKTSTISKNSVTNDMIGKNQETSSGIGEILTLGLLGGGCYWGYKKYKKK